MPKNTPPPPYVSPANVSSPYVSSPYVASPYGSPADVSSSYVPSPYKSPANVSSPYGSPADVSSSYKSPANVSSPYKSPADVSPKHMRQVEVLFTPPPAAPSTYSQAVEGVPPSGPYVPNQAFSARPIIVRMAEPLGSQPTLTICPHCSAEVDTLTKTRPGFVVLLLSLTICLFGCYCGCCLIPCCIKKCKDIQHNCPHCNAYLGRFRRC